MNNTECTKCPVATGTHKPAEATHQIDEPQAEALRLAEYCDNFGRLTPISKELRRLHARVQELEAAQARVPLSANVITHAALAMHKSVLRGCNLPYEDPGEVLLDIYKAHVTAILEAVNSVTQEKQGCGNTK